MTAYALATFWGWHLGPRLQQRPWVRSQLLLLTCGIWLELVFFDLLPSTQPTLMGILGFRMATLFSLILFFTPVILMSGLHSFVGLGTERALAPRGLHPPKYVGRGADL